MARTEHERDRDNRRDRSPKRRRYSSSPDQTSYQDRSRHRRNDYDRRDDRRDTRDRRDDRRDTRDRRDDRREPRDRKDEHHHRRREQKDRSRSRSPPRRRTSRSPPRRSAAPLPSQDASFALTNGEEPPVEKQKPNYAASGLLAKEANTVSLGKRAVVLKYHEPAEGRKPPSSQKWTLFCFAGKETKDTLALGDRSCWLFGREKGVVDILLDDPTASKQHAVIQFRYSLSRNEYGEKLERVRPYVLDLESKSGTMLNGKKIEAGRYVELRDADVLVFGAEDDDGGKADEWVLMLPPAE